MPSHRSPHAQASHAALSLTTTSTPAINQTSRPQHRFSALLLRWALILLPLVAAVLLVNPANSLAAAKSETKTVAREVVKTPHVEAKLIARDKAFVPGQPIEAALRLAIIPHWHTYWQNPGDSGLPTKLKWTLPAGFTAEAIRWPYPKKLPLGPLMNFGYEGEVLHLVTINTPTDVPPGTVVNFTAKADWLVCADVCIPEEGELALTLTAVAAKPLPDTRWAAAFDKANAALPAKLQEGVSTAVDGMTLTISTKTALAPSGATFFPLRDDVMANAAKQTYRKTADGFSLAITLAEPRVSDLATLAGVLVADGASADRINGFKAVSIDAPVAGMNATGDKTATPASHVDKLAKLNTGADFQAKMAGTPQQSITLLSALGLAFLGGLILNLMPCVFPVLGIKVMGFVENAHGDSRLLRSQGIAFLVGVVVSFIVLAGLMLALRAAGQAIGWGFQLQEPLFVAALAVLFFVMALNLSGLFEIGTRLQSAAGNAELQTQKSPLIGAFSSGVLATAVATPCMAPGLGASVGFTLGQSAPVAMLVFLSIAVGLALPIVLLSFFPALLRFLPKPGAWMETFKQLMAFPLYGTVVWLAWVLGAQTGNDGVMMLLTGLTLLALATWLYGRWQRGGAILTIAAVGVFAALGLAAVWNGARTLPPEPVAASGASSTNAVSADGWVPFSKEKIADLRKEGRAVFVDFTATWCITCQVNKRVALNQDAVVARMAEANVVRMKADWTRKDATITAALAEFGRNGVPLYVLYPAQGEPMVLPEVLTPSIVLEAVNSVVQR
jgi:thiol:disulfide interchange protein